MFKKLKQLWNPVFNEGMSKQPNSIKLQRSIAKSSIELRKKLLGLIVKNKSFQHLWDSDEISDTFVLWVSADKPAYQIEIRKEDFLGALHKEFDDRELRAVGAATWLIETNPLPEDVPFIKITDGLYLEIRGTAQSSTKNPPVTPTKAKISISHRSGSLLQNEYVLDATKQQIYQIGRGEKDKASRKNHIAISDNVNDVLYKNNRFVSNAHAQIVFVENEGFCLKSLNNKSRTIVYRRGNRIADIRDIYSTSKPLQDGDRIELEKTVLLKFEIIN